MKKRQNAHISETEKVCYVIMTSFFNQKHLKFYRKTCGRIVFAHIKFGLVRIKGSGVKRGRSERVFEIPAWIGLSPLLLISSVFGLLTAINYLQ